MESKGGSPLPLRSERIESKPKHVNFYQFQDEVGATAKAALLLEFNQLQDDIANGSPIPLVNYRLGLGKTKDRLLEERGIKHLHLGGRGSETLVYLIETDDTVTFLRISDHRYLEDEPRGSSLLRALGLR